MNYDRRTFIKGMTVVAAAIPFSGVSASEDIEMQKKKYPISFFTKPLDKYATEFMAETLAMAGLDGFDLTVRPGGRVNPVRIVDDLPVVIEMGKKYGLSTEMIVTAIKDADDPNTKKILRIASEYGIKHYRMGYFDYDFKQGIWESLNKIKNNLGQLALLNKEFGIQAGYQNHSGTRVGAPMWDVWELVRDYPVEFLSSQFDIHHAVTEGAASWVLALRLLSNNIGSLAIKDFTWQVVNRKAKVVNVPLGQGIVDFDTYFKTLKELGIVAPITLHVEYPFLSKEEENLPLLAKQKIIAAKLKKDVDFIRSHLKKFQMI